MRKADGGQQMAGNGRRGPGRRFPIWLFCLVVLAAGCAGSNNSVGGDPLVGGGPPLPRGPAAAVPAAPATPTARPVALPPVPASSGAPSNAALAAGTSPPLDGRHDLGIADPRSSPSNPAWAGQTTGGSPPPVRAEPASGSMPLPARGSSYNLTDGSRLASYEQAKAQLVARGVTWFRLETADEPGSYKFSCSVPNRQNRMINRTYEAQGPSELAAIQAVLDQIDKER
jgi:hypothetical protein